MPRRPGRPRDPKLKEEILELAGPAFAEHGYAGTSLADLARLAGRTKAALLHHFESKQALYYEVIARFLGDMGTLIAQAGVDDGPFVERLDRLGALVVDYMAARPLVAQLMLAELIGRGPFVRGPGEAPVQATLGVIREFLLAGMEAGDFERQDPEQLALSIVGVHLFYFGAHTVGSAFQGADVFDPEMVERRKRALLEQVRALVVQTRP